jgi:phosphomannomutase
MVTGSHIPFDRNGYKINTSKGELRKEQEAPIDAQVRRASLSGCRNYSIDEGQLERRGCLH